MLIISYDISNDKLRDKFSKVLRKNGAIRLQYSVYEFNNTNRLKERLKLLIDHFSKQFTGADSVVVFEVQDSHIIKYGNAIHRDKDMIFI
ncbi:MAG: CRISPR-associated endonuclease Cas2 [Bacteroidales bacterium]|nr:CRISPR-associated endonuclease Cas2 [Bacteroidales bacterium]